MSYAAGEAAILTLIQAITPSTWTETNSLSLANDTDNKGHGLLNNGKSHHYVMLEPGGFQVQDHDAGYNTHLVKWQTLVTIYAEHLTNRAGKKVLAEDRQAIIDKLQSYHRLNNLAGVTYARVLSGSKITTERIEIPGTKKRKVLFKQEVIVTWDELVSVTQAD